VVQQKITGAIRLCRSIGVGGLQQKNQIFVDVKRGAIRTHLALVRYRYQNIRANILYARLDPKGRGRIQISAELPLIYATGRRSEPPEVNYPANPEHLGKPMRARASKLETEPLLRSLPVYRYREH